MNREEKKNWILRVICWKFFFRLSEWRNGEVSSYFYEFWPWIPMLNCKVYCILTWFGHAWKIWIWIVDKKKKRKERKEIWNLRPRKGVEHLISFLRICSWDFHIGCLRFACSLLITFCMLSWSKNWRKLGAKHYK